MKRQFECPWFLPWAIARTSAIVAACLVAWSVTVGPAYSQAPASLSNAAYFHTRHVMGLSVFEFTIRFLRSDGTYARVYHQSSIANFPSPPHEGTYTYRRTAPGAGELTMTPNGSSITEVHLLNFTTAPDASYSDSTGGGGPFLLATLPLTSPLVNTSQRAWVTHEQPAIIGFVIPPGRSAWVLIRAAGPALAGFPGTTPAIDPELDLYATAQQRLIGNDDWGANDDVRATLRAIGDSVGAFPFATGSADAALLRQLAPGTYTVHVRNAIGEPRAEVLGEVYLIMPGFVY